MAFKSTVLALCVVALAVALHPSLAAPLSCRSWSDPAMGNCVELAPNVVLQWVVLNDTITFNHTVQAPNVGFLALGLSETGSMRGADMMVLSGSPGKWSLTDRYAEGFQMPKLDTHQDLVLRGVHSVPQEGVLSAKFSRKLAPCDPQDLVIRRGEKQYILYAFGPRLGYHGQNRGSKLLGLHPVTPGVSKLQGSAAQEESGPAPSSKIFNMSINALEIPARETAYMYQWFKMPSDRKYHILSYRPRLGTTGDKFAHHAVVYACSPDMNEQLDKMASPGPVEASRNTSRCNDFYMLLTPWSPRYSLPPQAGLPFGKGSYTWMMLEIHYNNPDGLTGVKDQGSGVMVEYTDQLRPHDMGLITLTQLQLNIPPGLPTYSAPTSYCLGDCTKKIKQRINLVDQTYHMHGLGKSAITRRFRGGRELSPLGKLRTFDYKYQPFVPLPADASVLEPGDTLAFTCTFDSTSRKNITLQGPGTQDEMCFHWIYYWPAQPSLAVCSTFPGNATRPDVGICAPSLAPLFMNRSPEMRQRLYAAGLLMNVTKPTKYISYTEPCTSSVAT